MKQPLFWVPSSAGSSPRCLLVSLPLLWDGWVCSTHQPHSLWHPLPSRISPWKLLGWSVATFPRSEVHLREKALPTTSSFISFSLCSPCGLFSLLGPEDHFSPPSLPHVTVFQCLDINLERLFLCCLPLCGLPGSLLVYSMHALQFSAQPSEKASYCFHFQRRGFWISDVMWLKQGHTESPQSIAHSLL